LSESADDRQAPTQPAGRLSRPRRQYALRLLLAAVACLATLKLADVVVGQVVDSRERHLLRLVPGASLRHKSSEFDYIFRTNRLGLRGPDVPFAKPAGTFRIVMLGDSFVAGYGVAEEHLLTKLLQEKLSERNQPGNGPASRRASPVEVINVGRNGTSTIRELDLYEQIGRRFQPDLVILAYYLGNDLAEVVQEHTRAELAGWHPEGWIRRLAFAAFPNLYLELAMIRQSRRQQREFTQREQSEIIADLRSEAVARGRDSQAAVARYESLPSQIRDEVAEGMLSEQRIVDSCIEPDRLERALDGDSPGFAAAWKRTVEHLDELHQSVRRDHAELAIVAIPAPFQVDRRSLDFHRALGYQVHQAWLESRADVSGALAEWAERRNVPLLDLTGQLRQSETPLYFVEDVHFTPAGNAAAAAAIAEFLRARRLCP
jgi:lysophospholipase L1-like esterase